MPVAYLALDAAVYKDLGYEPYPTGPSARDDLHQQPCGSLRAALYHIRQASRICHILPSLEVV
jgi:hypothetical protein